MRPADVPARPLLVDTKVVSQIVLREGRWEEYSALIGARPRYIYFAGLGELATFTRLSGLAVEKRTAMIAASPIGRCSKSRWSVSPGSGLDFAL